MALHLSKLGLGVLLLSLVVPLRADLPTLLNDALENANRDRGRWAYTESDVEKDGSGKLMHSSVVRNDPSKPYAEQLTPIEIDGKPPTDRDFKKYRAQGERRAPKNDNSQVEKPRKPGSRLSDYIDPNQITVSAEDAQTITYELGLKKNDNFEFPPEKFQAFARVNKEHRALERVSVQLRSSFRFKMLLKLKSAAVSIEFATLDPQYGTVRTTIHASGSASILFVTIGGSDDITRSDFKHVKPFDERFNVKIGPLKALDT